MPSIPSNEEIKYLLDSLSPNRVNNYFDYIRVISALANTSPAYKDLAEYFSMKSTKIDKMAFEYHWNNAIKTKNFLRKRLTINNTIRYFAKKDSRIITKHKSKL